ncbi:MAG: hypothetical protein SFW63_02095 [Alphaproteobacteria bacterium]|nr:hypothetical protein [Alphaproteobacteria bacterium]
MARQLSGARMDFATNQLLLPNGEIKPLSDGTNNLSLAISMAAFEAGAQLTLDIAPLDCKAHFLPMTRINLRAYTENAQAEWFDKRYVDLCHDMTTITNPDFYFAVADAAITGKFSLAYKLPAKQQELIVDMLSIAIAEYHLMLSRYGERTALMVPFYNLLIDPLLCAHGAANLDKDGGLRRAKAIDYVDWFQNTKIENEKNSRFLGELLETHLPHEYQNLQRGAGTSPPSLHSIIASLVEQPERYNLAVRDQLWRVFCALPSLAPMTWQR